MIVARTMAGNEKFLLPGPCDENDTLSSTSTCTTVHPLASTKKPHLLHQGKSRQVRFAPQPEAVVLHVLRRQDMSDQDIRDRFLVQDDVMAIRAHAKLTTKYYRSKDPHMMNAIDSCFNGTSQLVDQAILDDPQSTTNNNVTKFGLLANLVDGKAMDEWCGRTKFHGRGLERYCSEHQRKVRANTILLARSRTVQAQHQCTNEDELAAIYRKYTRTAMVFALVMAKADHRAATESDEEDLMDERLAEMTRLTEINSNACAANPSSTKAHTKLLTRRKPNLIRRFKSLPSTI